MFPSQPCLSARLLGAAAAILLLALPATALAQSAEGVKRATHGDWDVLCAEGGDGNCVMRQIGKNAQGNDVMVVTVRALSGVKADNGQEVPAAIDVVAPLGVALRAGLRVKIDGGQDRAAPFDICIESGCLVRSPVGAEFLTALKAGNSASMTVMAPQQGEVAINISLRGFTKAFNSLR
ncbi:MAG: invasion associated locus B family protein [Pseudomonadota bacterium]